MKYEYIHDSLAKVVNEQVSTEVKARRKVVAMVKRAYQRFEERGVLLTEDDLLEIKSFRASTSFSKKEEAFIKKSEAVIKAAGKRKRLIIIGVISLLSIAAITSYFFYLKANEESKVARSNELAMQAIVNVEKNPTLAISSAIKAMELQDGSLQWNALCHQILPKNNGAEYLYYEEIPISKKARGVLSSPDEQYVLFTEDSLAYLYNVDENTRISAIPTNGKLTGSINSSSFSTDGEHLGLALDDGSLWLYNIQTKKISIREIHQNSIGTIQFTEDNKWILSASEDGKVILTALDSTVASITVYESDRPIKNAKFTSDETFISIVYDIKTDVIALVWDNQNQSITDTFEMTHFDGYVGFQTPHPFENKILYPKGNGTAVLWDLETDENIVLLHQTDRSIQQAQFSNDGTTILTISREGIVYTWDINGNPISETESLSGVVDDAYFTNQNLDIIARYKNGFKLWDGESGQLKSVLNGFRFWVDDFTYLPTKDFLISTSHDETPKLWQLYSNKLSKEYRIKSPSDGLINIYQEDLYAYSQEDLSIAIWNFEEDKYWETPSISNGVSALKFYKDKLLIANEDGQLLVYDLISEELNTIIETEEEVIINIEVSKDGQYLLIQTEEQAKVWKIKDDSLLNIELKNLPDNLIASHFIGSSNQVLGYNIETSKVVNLDLNSNTLKAVSDSLLLTQNEFNLKVNSLESGGLITTVYDEAFLMDWEKQKTYSFDEPIGNGLFYEQDKLITWFMGDVKFWNISGKPVSWHSENIFPNDDNLIEDIQLSPDQQFLFFRSNDNIVKIYNLKKGTKQPLVLVYEMTMPSLDNFFVTTKGDELVFQLYDRIIIYPFNLLKIKQAIQ